MHHPFDRVIKENFREPSIAFLKYLFGIDVADTQILPSKLQRTIPEREADMLVKVTTTEGRVFIAHVEWQTVGDPDMRGRMLLYHALVFEIYKIEVLGFAIYLGNQKAGMLTHLIHGNLSYSFELIDPRQLDPYVFLQSKLPEEIILAILAGSINNDRRDIIRKIISKLARLLKGDEQELKRRIQQLEILSLLRDEQKLVNEEEQRMALTIDFTKDIRYQQGIEVGVEEGMEKGIKKKSYKND